MRTYLAEPSHPLKLTFSRENGAVDEIIDQLIEVVKGVHYPAYVREMILTALKAGQEDSQKADIKLMTSALKEMRFTAKVFGPYRAVRKVTIFGSARIKSDNTIYQHARELGEKLSGAGYMVITGGGPGIMQAANEGAGSEHSFGVNIRLPFENRPNHILEGSPRSITYKYFFNRKVAFIKEADAVALFPGGFGTLDEAMEVLTLVQTGKRYPIPLILVDEPGGTYWSHWKLYVEQELAARGYISKNDFSLFDIVQSVDDAVEIVDRFYRRYHSLRFVGDRLVIRINSPVDREKIRELKEQYSDLLLNGGDIFDSEALPEESDEPIISHLPRLVLDFNRREYGRLRQLIDSINSV
ncbi:MAG: TIGR00730 family Rossman fold protein [Syntrophobacteraceae bacterium]